MLACQSAGGDPTQPASATASARSAPSAHAPLHRQPIGGPEHERQVRERAGEVELPVVAHEGRRLDQHRAGDGAAPRSRRSAAARGARRAPPARTRAATRKVAQPSDGCGPAERADRPARRVVLRALRIRVVGVAGTIVRIPRRQLALVQRATQVDEVGPVLFRHVPLEETRRAGRGADGERPEEERGRADHRREPRGPSLRALSCRDHERGPRASVALEGR